MNKQHQKWIRLAVQIIRKALKIFHKEYLETENSNKHKEPQHASTQHHYLEEGYQDRSSDHFHRDGYRSKHLHKVEEVDMHENFIDELLREAEEKETQLTYEYADLILLEIKSLQSKINHVTDTVKKEIQILEEWSPNKAVKYQDRIEFLL